MLSNNLFWLIIDRKYWVIFRFWTFVEFPPKLVLLVLGRVWWPLQRTPVVLTIEWILYTLFHHNSSTKWSSMLMKTISRERGTWSLEKSLLIMIMWVLSFHFIWTFLWSFFFSRTVVDTVICRNKIPPRRRFCPKRGLIPAFSLFQGLSVLGQIWV